MNILLVSVQRNLDIIGLKGLHQLLLHHGYRSHLLYLPRFSSGNEQALAALRAFVEELAPRFIGVSLMTIDYHDAREATRFFKSFLPDTPVLWGGIHATTAPEMCARETDYVCIGEGERTLLDVAEAIQAEKPLSSIKNLGRLDGETFQRNPLYPLAQDLDAFPAVPRIPENSFAQLRETVIALEPRHLQRLQRYRGGVYKILTSRGCPYGCTYCCNNFLRKLYGVWKVRRRSVSHVMEELELAVRSQPTVEYIDFSDDCFLACDLEYLREFCAEYKRRIAKPFIAKSTPRYLSREKMDLIVDAGLSWMNMGLQSGSERVCSEIYKRNISPAAFLEAARLIHEYPVAAYYDVLTDNPLESVEDSLATVEILMQVPKPYYTLIFSLSFYHGTDLYDRMQQENPDRLEESFTKDYRFRERSPVNTLIEIAGLLPAPGMRRLVALFRRAPDAHTTRFLLFAARLYARWILSPITYFRLIRTSQKGSLLRTLRVLPVYLRDGLLYYSNRFGFLRTPEDSA